MHYKMSQDSTANEHRVQRCGDILASATQASEPPPQSGLPALSWRTVELQKNTIYNKTHKGLRYGSWLS